MHLMESIELLLMISERLLINLRNKKRSAKNKKDKQRSKFHY